MRRSPLLAVLPLLVLGTACDEGDTIIVNGDCGLIRSDLLGTWNIAFQPDTATLFNCSDPAFDDSTVTVTGANVALNDVEVFASAANAGFQFQNSTSPRQIFGNVETDTCNMLFAFLDSEGQYLQCIGEFDPDTRTLRGACDSTTVLLTPVTNPPVVQADCDLDPILRVTLTIP